MQLVDGGLRSILVDHRHEGETFSRVVHVLHLPALTKNGGQCLLLLNNYIMTSQKNYGYICYDSSTLGKALLMP